MMKEFIITTLTISIITAGAFTANGDQGDGSGYGGSPVISEIESGKNWVKGQNRHSKIDIMFEILNLADDQQEEIKAIRENEQVAMAALRKQKRRYRTQMRKLINAQFFDEDAFRVIAEETSAVEVELAVSRARMLSKINAIMTPEQQELYRKLHLFAGKKDSRCHRSGNFRKTFFR